VILWLQRPRKFVKETDGAGAVASGLDILISWRVFGSAHCKGFVCDRVTGKKYDPTLHNAVERVPCNDEEEGTILEETKRGYAMEGRLIGLSIVEIAVPPVAEPTVQDPLTVDRVE